jgi:hypothetical protein
METMTTLMHAPILVQSQHAVTVILKQVRHVTMETLLAETDAMLPVKLNQFAVMAQ